jgi:hypothetical protein
LNAIEETIIKRFMKYHFVLPFSVFTGMIHINERRKSSGDESAKFADLSLQVALGRVPCSQTSLYRLP